jgi:GTPase involved in cell partitioning and DNA repair
VTVLMLVITLISCGGSGGSDGGGGGGGGVLISVNPKTRTLFPTQQQQFTATVTGSTNNAVNWTASLGTIDASGLYTAPPVTSTSMATVTAVALADVTRSSSATVTIQQPTQSGSYTLTITATSGGVTQSTTAVLNVQ